MNDIPTPDLGRPTRLIGGLWLVIALTLAVASCSGEPTVGPSPTVTTITAPTTTSMPPDPTTTTRPVTTTTASPTTTTAPRSGPPLADPSDPDLRVLFSIPVGEGGVTYGGGFEDWETSGPQALTVAHDGSIWIADTSGRRLLRYSEDGSLLTTIDTDEYGVAGLIDLASVDDGVWGLEIVPAVGRYRIVLFDDAGVLVEEHELPVGLHLEDGLSGITTTPDGRLWIELEGGATVYEAFDGDAYSPHITDGYEIDGIPIGPVPSGEPDIARFGIGDSTIERPIREHGSIAFEGAIPGWVILLVSDVEFDEEGALSVDLSVLCADLSGDVTAIATYPLDVVSSAAYVPQELIAVGREGQIVALKPGTDGVEVVELALRPIAEVEG
jgi:hypothetical protein